MWIRTVSGKRGHDDGEGDDEGEAADDEHAPATKKPAKKKARASHAETSPSPEKSKRRRHRRATDEEGETDPPQKKKRRGRGRKEKDVNNDGGEGVPDAMDPKSQPKGMFFYFVLSITNLLYMQYPGPNHPEDLPTPTRTPLPTRRAQSLLHPPPRPSLLLNLLYRPRPYLGSNQHQGSHLGNPTTTPNPRLRRNRSQRRPPTAPPFHPEARVWDPYQVSTHNI